jgi:hypothetical protein
MENIRERKYIIDQYDWLEQGSQKGRLETARKMKADNLPLDTIQKYTDLSAETIQSLQP